MLVQTVNHNTTLHARGLFVIVEPQPCHPHRILHSMFLVNVLCHVNRISGRGRFRAIVKYPDASVCKLGIHKDVTFLVQAGYVFAV